MTDDADTREGQCHCGAVRFEARLSDGFDTIRRCTCSYCRMRGAVAVSAAMGGIRFVRGEDVLTSYRFNSGEAQHFFCSRCGIYTHHQRRSNPAQYGVNVACLDGVSPFDFAEVPVLDGVRHPNDTGGAARRAGTLRFEAADRPDRPEPGTAYLARTTSDRPGARTTEPPCRFTRTRPEPA